MPAPALAARLAAFVGSPPTDFVGECAAAAARLVGDYIAGREVPGEVRDRAVIEVGADLYHRRSARNGVAGFEDTDIAPAPVRINRDPLVPAYPLLARYLGWGIA